MKKILSLLSALTVVASTSVTVISCGQNPPPVITDSIEKVIQDFKEEVNEIVNSHIKEKSKYFFIVDEEEKNNLKFFQKKAFSNYMGKDENKKADNSIREDLIDDFYNILQVNELKNKLDSLKNLEKYAVILGDIDSVFNEVKVTTNDNIDLTSKGLINNNEEIVWFGTSKFNYSISVNFKNQLNQIEQYKIEDIPCITTVTNNLYFGEKLKNMYMNIEQEFIKNMISRVYSSKLNLLSNKTYLQDTNSEILQYLNGQDNISKFSQFVSNDFDINLKIKENSKSFNNLKSVAKYRENSIHYSGSTEAKGIEYNDIFFKNTANISKIISETYKEHDNKIKTAIEDKINKISTGLSNNEEVVDIINASLKMFEVNLTDLTYQIDDQFSIEIPDLNLSFGYFKDSFTKSRNQLDNDITKNVADARYAFNNVFETTYTPNVVQQPLFFWFKDSSKIYDAWTNKLGIYGITDNINSFTNLTHQSLIDSRNKLIKDSKQSDFKFDVWLNPWTADEYKPYFGKASNRNRRPEIALIKESKLEVLIPINMSFEFDYLKWSVSYSKTSFGQRVFGLSNTE